MASRLAPILEFDASGAARVYLPETEQTEIWDRKKLKESRIAGALKFEPKLTSSPRLQIGTGRMDMGQRQTLSARL